jgi:hypothetical protein
MKKKEKITLPFVNNGKPFTISNWTVQKHTEALELMVSENGENLSEKEEDALFRFYVVYVGLKEVDSTVEFESVKNMHPENLITLFKLIYTAGKVDIFFRGK